MPAALITGASGGIGEEFARQLAGGGYNLVITARREEKLERLKDELTEKFSVSVGIIRADLAEREDVNTLVDKIQTSAPFDILVNNAGFGVPGEFAETDIEKHINMTDVHISAMLRLTHAALRKMLSAGSGAIINVSSIASFLPIPGGTTYSASKSYMTCFSEALRNELRGTNIRVQALCPGYTATGFHYTPDYKSFNREKIPGFLWTRSEDVVRCSLQSLKKNKVICVPGLFYRILYHILTSKLFRGPFLAFAALMKRKRVMNEMKG